MSESNETVQLKTLDLEGGHDIHDVKDRTPNPGMIEVLEKMLEEAKQGELRSLLVVEMDNKNEPSYSWIYDRRTDRKKMLGEIQVAMQDFTNHILLNTAESVTYDGVRRIAEE